MSRHVSPLPILSLALTTAVLSTVSLVSVEDGRAPGSLASAYEAESAAMSGIEAGVAGVRRSEKAAGTDGVNQAPATPTPIIGYADLHVHQFAYEGLGGQLMAGEAFGPITDTLKACDQLSDLHGQGLADLFSTVNLLEAFASFTNPLKAVQHGSSGHPLYLAWPRWDNVTHQAAHQEMLKRAWSGGLRLMVMMAVNSKRLCDVKLLAESGKSCGDFPNMYSQIQAAREMEEYVGDKDGGWYRIVTSPSEARQVIAQGKLAVVLGVEGSDILDAAFYDGTFRPVDDGHVLDTVLRYYSYGVRHIFPVHHNDNALGGSALFVDPQWPARIASERDSSVSFEVSPPGFPRSLIVIYDRFIVERCQNEGYQYPQMIGFNQVVPAICNARGLTAQGELFLKSMMSKSVIIDADHMSRKMRNQALDYVRSYNYPVAAGHAGFLDITLGNHRHEEHWTSEQIRQLIDSDGLIGVAFQGGPSELRTYHDRSGLHGSTVIPHQCGRSSESFAQAYLYAVDASNGGAVAFGSDINSFGRTPGPRVEQAWSDQIGVKYCADGGYTQAGGARVAYPFTAIATGANMPKHQLGQRTFDINFDGFAHIGMLPDFVEELRVIGITDEELKPLLHSAEGYIRMWEKAEEAAKNIPAEPSICRQLRTAYREILQNPARPPDDPAPGRPVPVPPPVQTAVAAQNKLREERMKALSCRARAIGCWVDYVGAGTDCRQFPNGPSVQISLANSMSHDYPLLAEGTDGDFVSKVTDHNRFGPYEGVWAWGDGGASTFTQPIDNIQQPDGSKQSFVDFERRDAHAFGDDGGYPVQIRVSDAFSGTGHATLAVSVTNAAPAVGAIRLDKPSIWPGQVVNLSTTFTDPGWLDTHTATVDWGDGSPLQVARVTETNNSPRAEGSIAEEHKYAAPGAHVVRVTVADDDGGTTTVTTTIKVSLSPDMPGMLKVDKELNFLQWTVGDAFSISAAEFEWRTGSGAAQSWWLYQDGDWLYVFRTHPGDVPTYDGGRPTVQRLNFIAYAVPVVSFQRWFWCGTVYGCHPRYGPRPHGAGQWHPWVIRRFSESKDHINAEFRKMFG